jgi:hypothetical protein
VTLALERHPAATGAERVLFHGPNSVTELNAVLVGHGIAGTATAAAVLPAGELTWRQTRDETDELGMRHLFYRQILRPAASLAALIEPRYGDEGIERAGGEIGVHSHGDVPRAVFGTHFRSFVLAAQPSVTRAWDAFQLAQAGAATWPGFLPQDWSTWSAWFVQDLLDRSRPLFMSTGDGRTFRLVWEVPTVDSDGSPHDAYLDAASGLVVRIEGRRMNDECSPSTRTSASASGISQSGCNSPRSLKATQANDRLPDFTHEAMRTGSTSIPDIELYFSLPSWEAGFSRYMCPNTWYGMVPLKTVGGTVTYDDWTVEAAIPGRAAADAIHFTYQTMYTFKNNLGRFSYDGHGATARVVIDDRYDGSDNAQFHAEVAWCGGDLCAPVNSVGISPRGSRPYTFAACLDVIAHEWGHGVVHTSADWDYGDEVGGQLHEGFADVIGYATEWYRQPAGSGCEKAEWKMGEDNGRYVRRVDEDDGDIEPDCSVPPELGVKVCDMAYHKDDEPSLTQAHARGNMLGVAYRLLKDGGQNPVCSRLPGLSGCDVSVQAQGLLKSSTILFRVLTVYATSATAWEDLGGLAVLSAFDLFSKCAICVDAAAEQQAASDAFTAIGYPGGEVLGTCPSCS